MKTVNKLINLWLPVLIWAYVIFLLSSIPSVKVSDFFFWDYLSKKAAHVGVYAILYTLIYRATNNFITAFILTFLYCLSDEFHQSFVPGRTASPLDLGFDISGANIAAYTIWKLKQLHPKKHKKSAKK